ncbi:predicted protein [Naegleria gruberi]|uniref:Predicted protein n=1 Tax=Naegleria gruberi TaxID=5762 RepID=D2W1G4_NAEGR|nr:uncharacterized protein NAEGRDRAFT_53963 [Naegleria gruberi]EFC37085.1 predicted protein [Naegleria gruberi]|eukprot:XP_002669829.1 predicted protein [Naegleria gruberi strain NEG-M]
MNQLPTSNNKKFPSEASFTHKKQEQHDDITSQHQQQKNIKPPFKSTDSMVNHHGSTTDDDSSYVSSPDNNNCEANNDTNNNKFNVQNQQTTTTFLRRTLEPHSSSSSEHHINEEYAEDSSYSGISSVNSQEDSSSPGCLPPMREGVANRMNGTMGFGRFALQRQDSKDLLCTKPPKAYKNSCLSSETNKHQQQQIPQQNTNLKFTKAIPNHPQNNKCTTTSIGNLNDEETIQEESSPDFMDKSNSKQRKAFPLTTRNKQPYKMFQSCPTNINCRNSPTTSVLTLMVKQSISVPYDMEAMKNHSQSHHVSNQTYDSSVFELEQGLKDGFLNNLKVWTNILSFLEEYEVLWNIRPTCNLFCTYSFAYERLYKTSFVVKHDLLDREELKRLTIHNLIKLPNLNELIISKLNSELITYEDIKEVCLRELLENDIKLEKIDIDCHLDQAFFELLKQTKSLAHLKSLKAKSITRYLITNCTNVEKSRRELVQYLAACKNLESLEFTFLAQFDDDLIPLLKECSKKELYKGCWMPSHLKHLAFVVSTVSVENMKLVVTCCPNLESLKIACSLTHHQTHVVNGSTVINHDESNEIHALEIIGNLKNLTHLDLTNPILTNRTLNYWIKCDMPSRLKVLRLNGNSLLELHRFSIINGDIFTNKDLPHGVSKEQSDMAIRNVEANTCSFDEMEMFLRKLHMSKEIDIDLTVLLSNLDIGSPSNDIDLSFLGSALFFPHLEKLSISGFTSTMKNVIPFVSGISAQPSKISQLSLHSQMLGEDQMYILPKLSNLKSLTLSLSMFNVMIKFPSENLTKLFIYYQDFTYMNLSSLLEQALRPLEKLRVLVIGSIDRRAYCRSRCLTTSRSTVNNYLEEITKAIRVRANSLEILKLERQQLTEKQLEHLKVFKKLRFLKIAYELNANYMKEIVSSLTSIRTIVVECCCLFHQQRDQNDTQQLYHQRMSMEKQKIIGYAPHIKIELEEMHCE